MRIMKNGIKVVQKGDERWAVAAETGPEPALALEAHPLKHLENPQRLAAAY